MEGGEARGEQKEETEDDHGPRGGAGGREEESPRTVARAAAQLPSPLDSRVGQVVRTLQAPSRFMTRATGRGCWKTPVLAHCCGAVPASTPFSFKHRHGITAPSLSAV